jgi:hypothetical protein
MCDASYKNVSMAHFQFLAIHGTFASNKICDKLFKILTLHKRENPNTE